MTTSAAAPEPPPRIGRTERIVRPASGRVIAGVCAGIAEHLGLDVLAVRIVFVVLAFLGGSGVVGYAALWIFTPVASRPLDQETGRHEGRPGGDTGAAGSDGDAPQAPSSDSDGDSPEDSRRAAFRLLLFGGLVFVAAVMWLGLLLAGGPTPPPLVVAGVAAVLLGLYLAWTYLDNADLRTAAESPAGSSRRPRSRSNRLLSWLVPVLGVVLVVSGALALIASTQGLAFTGEVMLSSVVVLAGVVTVALPWGVRAWRRFVSAEQQRIRETERADMAAHLHDSVLQTLALIQRTDDQARVKLLARVQERELRAWLYGGGTASPESFAAALTAIVHEVEETHGVPIDVVTSGDRRPHEATDTLLRALRESLLNAVRHGAPPVSVYAEAGPRRVEAFVRDHGPGFDIDSIPEGRLGVRESIMGRMQRIGGTARIRRREDGTEVELAVDIPDEPDYQPDHEPEFQPDHESVNHTHADTKETHR